MPPELAEMRSAHKQNLNKTLDSLPPLGINYNGSEGAGHWKGLKLISSSRSIHLFKAGGGVTEKS